MSSYEYNELLKFLYFEGYADSYKEAECILEDMSDEEFEELNESRRKAAHSFPLTKQELKYVASMERMGRGDYSSSPAGRSSTETRSARKADPTSTTPTTSKPTRKSEFIDRSGASDQGNIGSRRRIREERENFDIITEFLFVEGYTDTIESAELMAENISETWVNQILDEKFVGAMDTTGRGPDHRTRFPKFKGKDDEFDPKFTQQRVNRNDKKIDPYFSGRRKRKDERRQGTGGVGG